MNRFLKNILTGIIAGPVIVLADSFPEIFTDTKFVLSLMLAASSAGALGFLLLGIYPNARFWVKAIFAVVAGSLAGATFALLRPGKLSLVTSTLWGAVLLPCYVLIESGYLNKKIPTATKS